MNKNEKTIAKNIFYKWLRSDVAARNIYFFAFESDILALKPSGYLIEYEIKISVSDFRADFKKSRANHFDATITTRHEFLLSGKGANKFYYVMPDSVYNVVKDEIPDYCGIITVYENNRVSFYKHPKQLHKNKADPNTADKIMKAMYWKAWNA